MKTFCYGSPPRKAKPRSSVGYKHVQNSQARAEFIDPFLESLGWDARNVQGRGEHDKDV
ncbi:MAG: hypothetical protein V3S14_07800 [Anaerolineae bacterium]